MTRAQQDLMMVLALAVHAMSPPDTHRSISRALEDLNTESMKAAHCEHLHTARLGIGSIQCADCGEMLCATAETRL